MNASTLLSSSFRVVDYSERNGAWRAGFHCPSCGKFYATARYTLETDEAFLGNGKIVYCCGRQLSLPHTFEHIEEINALLRSINRNVLGTRAVLIAKKHVIIARFRPDARPESSPH